jgi:hypothetical protein
MSEYKKTSLSHSGAILMGTGVMIGAAIFALVGQVAAPELLPSGLFSTS